MIRLSRRITDREFRPGGRVRWTTAAFLATDSLVRVRLFRTQPFRCPGSVLDHPRLRRVVKHKEHGSPRLRTNAREHHLWSLTHEGALACANHGEAFRRLETRPVTLHYSKSSSTLFVRLPQARRLPSIHGPTIAPMLPPDGWRLEPGCIVRRPTYQVEAQFWNKRTAMRCLVRFPCSSRLVFFGAPRRERPR